MVSFRKKLCSKLPGLIDLRCVLHDFNNIAKHSLACNNETIKNVIQSNKLLVNYFTISFYYSEMLQEWRVEFKIKHQLETYSESRWYSFSKVRKN